MYNYGEVHPGKILSNAGGTIIQNCLWPDEILDNQNIDERWCNV